MLNIGVTLQYDFCSMFRHKNALFAIVFILFGMNQLNAQNGFGYLIGKVTNENALPVVDAKISFSDASW